MDTHQYAVLLLLFLVMLIFPENGAKLYVSDMLIPDPFIYGSSTDLYCNYTWDSGENSEKRIYSIKWYKENEEFFRFVPAEDPPIITFHKDGVFVDENRSSAVAVHLRIVHWNTAGTYRCEITADDFETASMAKYSEVVAVPVQNPYIFGQKPRYLLGEFLDLNCTSNSSDPVAELFWYINSESVKADNLIEYPAVREQSNLLSAVLGLKLRIVSDLIKDGFVKVKCTAMLGNVYMKSNEISFEVKAPQKTPALESRGKSTQSVLSDENEIFEIPLNMDAGLMLTNMDGRKRKQFLKESTFNEQYFESQVNPTSGAIETFKTSIGQSLSSKYNLVFPSLMLITLFILTI